MTDTPSISVIISSRGESTKLARCLGDLAAQSHPPCEILLGLDGATDDDARIVRDRYTSILGERLITIRFDKVGLMPIRADLLNRARGEVFLSVNDDVQMAPSFVETHARAHAAHRGSANPAIITGPARWVPVARPTVFDEAVRLSDIIFFEQRPKPDGTLSYRECFGLNFSAPIAPTIRAGGFAIHPNTYGYEDIEIAHRMVARVDARVRYCGDAAVMHDHRYAPEDVMRREYELGRAAFLFARSSPEFASELFRRDITHPDERKFWRDSMSRSRRDAERIEKTMLELDTISAAEQEVSPLFARIIAEHWVVLKRLLWGWGLADQAANRPRRWSVLNQAPADLDP